MLFVLLSLVASDIQFQLATVRQLLGRSAKVARHRRRLFTIAGKRPLVVITILTRWNRSKYMSSSSERNFVCTRTN